MQHTLASVLQVYPVPASGWSCYTVHWCSPGGVLRFFFLPQCEPVSTQQHLLLLLQISLRQKQEPQSSSWAASVYCIPNVSLLLFSQEQAAAYNLLTYQKKKEKKKDAAPLLTFPSEENIQGGHPYRLDILFSLEDEDRSGTVWLVSPVLLQLRNTHSAAHLCTANTSNLWFNIHEQSWAECRASGWVRRVRECVI